jgi:hypothetical protein
MKVQIANLGGIESPGSPDDFGKPIVEETEKWANVIRAPTSLRRRSASRKS